MKRRDFCKSVSVQTLAASTLPTALLAENVIVTEVDPEPQTPQSADIVDLFARHMRLCNVREGETFLFYSNEGYARPEYITASLAAAKSLGANAFSLVALSGAEDSDMLLEAFMGADVVYGAIPLYAEAHNAAVRSGTRTLMVQQPIETLRRMFPDEDVIRRTSTGAKRIEVANEIRVTDDHGTDFMMNKAGRKGAYGCGVSGVPGRWDHWPSGLVTCAPNEDQAEGVYMINPGDIILGLQIRCQSQVKLTLEGGRLTKIEGGMDADMLRERLEFYGDERDPEGRLADAFRISHAGWGAEHRALWHIMGMDSEAMYGNTMVSLGRNMFDSLGGANYTQAHIDICCRNKRLYLDGDLIVDNSKIVPPELA